MSKGKQLNGQIKGDQEILSREQVLQILSEQARKGSITAAVHLERALRLGGEDDDDDEDPLWAELDAFRPTRRPRPSRKAAPKSRCPGRRQPPQV